jgi:hypothetical protein
MLAHRIALSMKQNGFGDNGMDHSSYSKALTVALDHTRVETIGIGSGDFGIKVAKSLRELLSSKGQT